MAGVIPDLYFPCEADSNPDANLQAHNVIWEGSGSVGEERELEGGDLVDLIPEGFIPIHQLTLSDLPEPIRTTENLQRIIDVAKRVVRINNNGLSEHRPDDDEFKMRHQTSMNASGFLWHSKDSSMHIITSRHVLYNEEELKRSTFDLFFDHNHKHSRETKYMQRCRRGDGMFFEGKCSKYDMVRVVYRVNDSVVSSFNENGPKGDTLASQWISTCYRGSSNLESRKPIVCLISHPLAGTKQVSFGEMFHYNVHTRTLLHDAPSKPGSSGGPLIIFSNRDTDGEHLCHVYHIGTDVKTRHKFAHFDYHDSSCMGLDGTVLTNPSRRRVRIREELTTLLLKSEDLVKEAKVSLEIMCLASVIPVFGAFLLQKENAISARLNTDLLKPCKNDLDSNCIHLPPLVKKVIRQIAKTAPKLCSSRNLDDKVFSFESQEPCFCWSVVKMMERGVKPDDDTVTMSFLSPHTTAAKMSAESDVTWPWLNPSSPDFSSHGDSEGECFMQKCLKIGTQPNGVIISATLLLMLVQANDHVKKMALPTSSAPLSSTPAADEGLGEAPHSPTTQLPAREETTRKQATERRRYLSSGLGDDQLRSTQDVLLLLNRVFERTSVSQHLGLFLHQSLENSHQKEDKGLDMLLSRCLALSDHVRQHEMQLHPDSAYSRQEGGRERCLCGKPNYWELWSSLHMLHASVKSEVINSGQDELSGTPNEDILSRSWHEMEEMSADYFFLLVRGLHAAAVQMNEGNPGQTILDCLETCFPQGRHSLMLYMAAGEALLYNCCLLARLISKHLQPLYFAFPVSVFGRPGNWPGNVTPPEVQRAAWRLIQDAIMASGFRPALLVALEKDAERRRKLIDVYVDMKQLKWERKIQPHLFESALASFRTPYRVHFMTQEVPFHDATAYFVWCVGFLVCPKSVGF